ncbi:glycosyltransferase family 25 protein [Oceanisphaera avium]|uniref:Glycosyl transferase family 25 domain-containing protein n=1 Tax=Oceanisphaera avium TaxID=1903694 RepID=A0A1Y0D026_9GAMM|nr:glycosyltransferase family 25 protein [Oceanisphaera avium]ART80940.1 hypothetical protein CBP12_12895 [Oceanisphaera avium]
MIPKIYVVSESADNPRLDQLYQQFPLNKNNFTVTPAVMGGTLLAAEYYNYVCKNYNQTQRILSPAEVGCALSHFNIYQSIIADQAAAIVFEDDIMGNDIALEQAKEIAQNIAPHQVVILGGMNGLPEEKLLKFINKDPNPTFGSVTGVKKIEPLAYPYLGRTCCYVLGHEAAAIIARKQESCLFVADAWGQFSKGTALDFYYINLFDHPILDEHANSYIEQERKGLIYIPSYKLAMRNMVRLVNKKVNQFQLSRR